MAYTALNWAVFRPRFRVRVRVGQYLPLQLPSQWAAFSLHHCPTISGQVVWVVHQFGASPLSGQPHAAL